MSSEQSHCKTVLATSIAKTLLEEVTQGVKRLDHAPLLVGFLATGDEGSKTYAEWTGKSARELGFKFELREVDKEELEDEILAANKEEKVDGIIVYYPIFKNRQDQYLQNVVDISKDVEALSHRYIFNLYRNIRFLDDAKTRKSLLPCTPLAVIKILEHLRIYNTFLPYGNRLHGRTITVINRSEVVGRPLAALLANDGACVYSVDEFDVQQFHRGAGLKKKRHEVEDMKGWKLEDALPRSDVVISGVPGEKFKVPVELLREGAVCINFSSNRNFSPDVKEKASIYVPAIGKVTIAVLLRNLLRVVQNQAEQNGKQNGEQNGKQNGEQNGEQNGI